MSQGVDAEGHCQSTSLTYNVKCLCCHTVNSSAPQFTQVYFYPHCLVDLLRKLKKGPSPHQPNNIQKMETCTNAGTQIES